MQLKISKVLLGFCFLQAFQIENLVWAQKAASRSSVEVTTKLNSGEAGVTVEPNSLENLASSETIDEQITTTTTAGIGIDSCEIGKSAEAAETCNCKCNNSNENAAGSGEVTTAVTSAEETTIEADQTTSVPPTCHKPTAAAASNSNENTEKPLPNFTCETAGNFPHPNDCHRYFNCYPIVNSTDFELIENVCPNGQAFNTEFSNCMRDLSACSRKQGGFECLEAGSFADPESNTTAYYRCVARLDQQQQSGATFHVFHVNCGVGKIFMPELGKCFYDLNAPQGGFSSPDFNGMPDDEQLVKAELKQWKLKEKTKLKEEKLKLKYEKKLQKELAKKANKEAKEKAKKEEKAKKGKNNYYDDDDY